MKSTCRCFIGVRVKREKSPRALDKFVLVAETDRIAVVDLRITFFGDALVPGSVVFIEHPDKPAVIGPDLVFVFQDRIDRQRETAVNDPDQDYAENDPIDFFHVSKIGFGI